MKTMGVQGVAREWVDAFPAFADSLSDPPWLRTLREEALACFAEAGLPHRKLEAWRSTSLVALEKARPSAPGMEAPDPEARVEVGRRFLDRADLPESDAHRAVFVDGHLCPDLSTLGTNDSGVRFEAFGPLADGAEMERGRPEGFGQLASVKEDAFTALNTAYTQGGGILEIAAGQSPTAPIHLVFLSTGSSQMVCPRLLVKARRASRACVILDFLSGAGGQDFVNAVSEVFVEANASLDCVLIQNEGPSSFQVNQLRIRQQRDSRLRVHTLSLGGGLVRNEIDAQLADLGAEVDLRGLYVGKGSQHVDNHTRVDHATPHTTSREIYKGILGEQSRGVFRGLVHVRPDAQKIDSQQSNMNLLLSDQARIDTRPQLEIHADDVKCSHGSTIGKLDDEALFYLRSRGLSENDARALLTRGFAAEICDALPANGVRAYASERISNTLAACVPGEIGVQR
ncbi:MAG: Fe-S cluster assembly protein SufD [Myxococcota bacterium]|nr:Fe-S cluster assembly protein SufD [Myxococcota bacterium]